MLFSKISTLNAVNLWEKILIWYQNSLIKELIDYFENDVFGANFGVYDNFSVSGTAKENIKNIIVGLMIGMIIAAALASYTRAVQGKFVRELLKRECHSPDTAITLSECGFFCNPSVRRELSYGGALSKITRCASESEADTDEKTDFLTARYYIPEDLKYRAEVRYTSKGFQAPYLILSVILCVFITVLLFVTLPILLKFADQLITALS